MPDTFQIGLMNSGRTDLGTVTIDLNSTSSGFQIVRDSFKIQAPERQAQFSQTSRRYGGANQTSETHGNGAVGASFFVSGASAEAAIVRWETLLSALEDTHEADYFLKWQPEGVASNRAVFYQIRGAASWEAQYRPLEFSQTKTLVFDVNWPVAPLARGAAITFSTASASYPAAVAVPAANGYSVGVPGTAPALLDLATAQASTTTTTSAASTTASISVSSTANLLVGQVVTGTGVPSNTTIATIASSTSLTVSQAVNVASGATLTFSPPGVDFFMVGWTQKPTLSANASTNVPFGAIKATTNGSTANTGVSVTNYTYATGGTPSVTRASIASPTAGTTYTLDVAVDPSTMMRDDFTRSEIQLEVWGRVYVNTLHRATVITSLEPGDAAAAGSTSRYTTEFGASGKLLAYPASGSGWYFYRLGTLPAVVDANNRANYKIRLATTFANTTTSTEFAIDYLAVVPAKQRALTPTGRALDSSYPRFINSTGSTTKTIRNDLSGWLGTTPYPDSGLGGQVLEIPPGDVNLFIKATRGVPDVTTTADDSTQTLTVTGTIIPRYFLARGS